MSHRARSIAGASWTGNSCADRSIRGQGRRTRQTGCSHGSNWILPGALSVLCAFLCLGCMGYRLGPVLKADYKSVAVVMFKNKTLQPQLEAQVSNGIIKRLQSDGTLRVDFKDNADIILTGQILHYQRAELRALRTEALTPREYRLSIEAQVEARDRITGKVILKPTIVTGKADTFIGNDLQSAEEQALPLIADDLARQVVSLLVESW